jgi:hypothetical protein
MFSSLCGQYLKVMYVALSYAPYISFKPLSFDVGVGVILCDRMFKVGMQTERIDITSKENSGNYVNGRDCEESYEILLLLGRTVD